jgi:hypothetical protein
MKTLRPMFAVALALITAPAVAGSSQPQPVTISTDTRTAAGDMLTARTSDNPFEYIGCGVRTFVDGGTTLRTGFCQAGISETQTVQCFTEDPALVETMAAGNDFSFVIFRWDTNNECIAIGFSTQSFYLSDPKAIKK